MKTIILTKRQNEGEKLRQALTIFDNTISSCLCLTKEDVLNNPEKTKDCEYIFSTWYMPEFTDKEVEKFFPSLKAIFYAAGTVKYFAEPFLAAGVRVFTASSANGIPVAEFAASQIVLANKGYFQAQKRYKWPIWHRGYFLARGYAERKVGNYGAKVGLLGCGAIGSKVVELLRPYKLEVFVYDPYLSDERVAELGVKKVGLEEMFKTCDVVSNHLPDIPETRGMIDEALLSSMKPTATLINTGRGAQVNETALNKVLKKHPDMCALLDVTSHEPLFPWSPLYWRKNVFLTPHIAGSLSKEIDRMVEYMVQAFHDTLTGKPNACETTLEIIEKQSTH
ncbi:MAG: hydroxyacid dehydrogenase [Prevotella sp.]